MVFWLAAGPAANGSDHDRDCRDGQRQCLRRGLVCLTCVGFSRSHRGPRTTSLHRARALERLPSPFLGSPARQYQRTDQSVPRGHPSLP